MIPKKANLIFVLISIAILLCSNKATCQTNSLSAEVSPRIIYADIADDVLPDYGNPGAINFYSIKIDGTEKKKLFTFKDDETSIYSFYPSIVFCPKTKKFYYERYDCFTECINEVDLEGNIRYLEFTRANPAIKKEGWEFNREGLAISPDGKNIVWSITYYKIANHKSIDAKNEIIVSDLFGKNKKVLISKDWDSWGNKEVKNWSSKFPEEVYLYDIPWSDKSFTGISLLSKINVTNSTISNLKAPPSFHIPAISPDENYVAYSSNKSNYFYIDKIVSAGAEGKDKLCKIESINGVCGVYRGAFSPNSELLAYSDFHKKGNIVIPRNNDIFVTDFNNKNYKIASDMNFIGWYSDNIILCQKDTSLFAITLNGNEKLIATGNFQLIFIGITED